ncbi:MAG: chromate transporter [Clostridia bacterium]|nr:chromate transporter [Clostridia bacterium]
MIYIKLLLSFLIIGFTSFGGTSMIPLISEQMTVNGWMTAAEVSDIVAIAEMTPGPLGVNCSTFAGMRTAGPLGALCAMIGVMMPSFTIALFAAVFMAKFRESRLIKGILYGIRPVCVGIVASVIVTLSISNYAGAVYGTDPAAIFIGVVAFIMMFLFKWSIPKTILLSGILGLCTVWLPF